MVQRVMQRVEDLVGIPLDNSEHLQILEYEIDQFYRTHHDYIPNQNQMYVSLSISVDHYSHLHILAPV